MRQNPTPMLADVLAGETYVVTRHNHEIARVVPTTSSAAIIPPKLTGPSRTVDLAPVKLPDGVSCDAFLEDLKGEQ